MAPTERWERTLVKSVTWRVVGAAQVMLLAALLTGSWGMALSIGVPDTVIKLALGIGHERVWQTPGLASLEYRRLYKTMSWKVFAVSSTIAVATWKGNYNFALKLGPIDTIFKSLTYYLHERIWDSVNWGLNLKEA